MMSTFNDPTRVKVYKRQLPNCDVQKAILQAIKQRQQFLIAYSGGVDSTVLLHAICELKRLYLPALQLRAIYIHHGLSDNADDWAQHCQEQCQNWQVPLIIDKVYIDKRLGNIEEQARNARYQAIRKHQCAGETVCTAQHLDDQSETFLLALKRGSGPAGLSGMQQESQLRLRPLLAISKSQIEAYANQHQLTWIEDESNGQEQYDRNFLRLSVLPTLTERWPHFSQMVARSSELCREQEQLLEELLQTDFKQLVTPLGALYIPQLINCSDYKRSALLRMWFKSQNVNMPSRKQLELIWQTVALAKLDANPQFRLAKGQLRRFKHHLYLVSEYRDIRCQILNWDLAKPLTLPDNLGELTVTNQAQGGCRSPRSDEKVTVRFQAQGKFRIEGRQGSRAIKKLWQEAGIPPWMRSRTPLLFYNEELITAVGVFITQQGAGNQLGFSFVPPHNR